MVYPDRLWVPMSVLVSITPFVERIFLMTTVPIVSMSWHSILTSMSYSPKSGWTSVISGMFPKVLYTVFSFRGLMLMSAKPIAMVAVHGVS